MRLLEPKLDIEFIEAPIAEKRAWILKIPAAAHHPVRFSGTPYIRVGLATKPLLQYPELERRLWRAFDRQTYESLIALDGLQDDEAISLIDYPTYFRLIGAPTPDGRRETVAKLERDAILSRSSVGLSITNLGALLFAHNLRNFPDLARKTVRVIQYDGNTRNKTIREREHTGGYAVSFESIINNIIDLLPANEVIGKAFREEHSLYPLVAIRELVANMLIHQDFTERGAGPMVELFNARMEISNPGRPLIDAMRFVDSTPKSRNESIAAMMRRCNLAEERGSGWDKVATAVEVFQLPAPAVQVFEHATKTTLFAHKPVSEMSHDDRVRSVYLHAVLRYISGEPTTNSSIRERFGIEQQNSAYASRLLKEAKDEGLIRIYDESAGTRVWRYIPFWAAPDRNDIA